MSYYVDYTVCSNCWEDITGLPDYLRRKRLCRACHASQMANRHKKLKAIYVPVEIADRVMNKAIAMAHAEGIVWKMNVNVVDDD